MSAGSHGHGEWEWDEPLRMPEVDQNIATILVPIDGSPGSERGLSYAALMASLTGGRVVVVVAHDPPVTVRRRGILEVEGARAEMEEEAKELASEAVELLTQRGLRASGVVVKGDPAAAILETAEEEGADLIVIGRRGLGRLAGLLLGSVSERIARHASVPVLLTS